MAFLEGKTKATGFLKGKTKATRLHKWQENEKCFCGWVGQNNSTKSTNGLLQANRPRAQLVRKINVDQFNHGK